MKLPDDLSPRDVRLWLHGGVVWTRIDGAREPVAVRSIDEDTGHVSVIRLGRKGTRRRTPVQIELIPPMSGFFNLPPVGVDDRYVALYADRLPKKQYTRTLRPEFTILRCMNDPDMLKQHSPILDACIGNSMSALIGQVPERLAGALSADWPCLEEANARLMTGALSVALSPALALVRSDRYAPSWMVAYHLQEVGKLENMLFVPAENSDLCARVGRLLMKKEY